MKYLYLQDLFKNIENVDIIYISPNTRAIFHFSNRVISYTNRVFLAKSAQILVNKPAGENPLPATIFSNTFSKICENLKNFTGSLAT